MIVTPSAAKTSASHHEWTSEALIRVKLTARIASVNRWRRRAERVAGPGWATSAATRSALRLPASANSCAIERVVRKSAVSPIVSNAPSTAARAAIEISAAIGTSATFLPISQEREQETALQVKHFLLFLRFSVIEP